MLPSPAETARALFRQRHGRPARWVARAPGRVNLIGEHVDYNDGPVLPLAIDAGVVLAGSPRADGLARIWSASLGQLAEFSVAETIRPGAPAWSNYLRGVVAGFQRRGVTVPGFDAVLVSDLPHGSGLSSSAALEVATATLLEALTETTLAPAEKALLCQRAEHEFAGVPCGIMDQFASVFGRKDHVLLLDCRSREVSPIAWPGSEASFLIMDTRVKHRLADGAYAQRRASCELAAKTLGVTSLRDFPVKRLPEAEAKLDPVTFRRVRHVVTEIARTFHAIPTINHNDFHALGKLMAASHASLRDDYEVSCPELDALVRAAEAIGPAGGVLGCRMTGGGFGGSAIALVRPEAVEAVKDAIRNDCRKLFGNEPGFLVTGAAEGAALESGGGLQERPCP